MIWVLLATVLTGTLAGPELACLTLIVGYLILGLVL